MSESTGKEWNPRYLEYATERGLTPDEALAADRIRWPGGCMAGFIIWCSEKDRETEEQAASFERFRQNTIAEARATLAQRKRWNP